MNDREEIGQQSEEKGPAVVTVGDELLFGERQNENQQWLLCYLFEQGFPAGIAMVLPDDVQVIASHLKELKRAGHAPILVSGGIGGTHDDRTREAVALALSRPLVRHPECFELLVKRYGDHFNEQRRRMADLPRGCRLIANPFGAPGFHAGGIYAYPGFPHMLHVMVRDSLKDVLAGRGLPWIQREFTLPVAEGEIARQVEAFSREYPAAKVGIYPHTVKDGPRVTVRLRVRGRHGEMVQAFERLERELREIARRPGWKPW